MFRTPRARLRALTTSLSTALSTARFRSACRRSAGIVATTAAILLVSEVPVAAYADTGSTVIIAANSLPQVITNLQKWIMGLLWSVAGLFAVLGAVYRMTAGGDTEKVTEGNRAFKNALIGAALAVLAPIFLQIVKGIVGG